MSEPEALPPITQQPVTSSNIESIGHCGGNPGRMCVKFKNGNQYTYEGVPPEVFDQIYNAPSVGSAFHKLCRGQYEFTQG
jgi:hypothetical protein